MNGAYAVEQQRRADRLARLVTSVTAPTNVALVLLIAVAVHSRGASGGAWGALAAGFASLLPLTFLLTGVRRGRWENRHVPDRTQRWLPLVVAGASVGTALVILILGKAPRPLVALLAAMLAGLALTLAISLVWKVSIHTAVVAGAVVVTALDFGTGTLAGTVPLLALVSWSRIQLGEHTTGQVTVGALNGALAACLAGLLQ